MTAVLFIIEINSNKTYLDNFSNMFGPRRKKIFEKYFFIIGLHA